MFVWAALTSSSTLVNNLRQVLLRDRVLEVHTLWGTHTQTHVIPQAFLDK